MTSSTLQFEPGPAAATESAPASSWRVDPAQSSARFNAATLWGRVPVAGELGPVSGELDLRGARGTGHLEISTRGISSGIGLRDHHLRSSAFFDSEEHPEVTLDASTITVQDGRARVAGELQVRGESHPFESIAQLSRIDEERIALETSADFDLRELGMSRGFLHMVEPRVTARVRVVLRPA